MGCRCCESPGRQVHLRDAEKAKIALRAQRDSRPLRSLRLCGGPAGFRPAPQSVWCRSISAPTRCWCCSRPRRCAALSPLARDPALSFVAHEAAHLPIVRASAEAVLRLHPDLILAAPFGAQTTLALLEQEGTPVLRVDLPQDFAGIRAPDPLAGRGARRAAARRGTARRAWMPASTRCRTATHRCAPWSGSRAASRPVRAR